MTHRVLCSVPATHRVLRHGDFLGVLRRGLLGLPHPPCQNQAEAAAQSGNTSEQPASADPRRPVTSENEGGGLSCAAGSQGLRAIKIEKSKSKAYHSMSSLFPKGQNYKGRALGTLPAGSCLKKRLKVNVEPWSLLLSCDLGTSSVRITRELGRNADSQATPQTC